MFVNKFFVRICCFVLGEQEIFVNIAEKGRKYRGAVGDGGAAESDFTIKNLLTKAECF